MNRIEFQRTIPEEVGIPSSAIIRFVDALEQSATQMHGLMIMRHGKVCAEGWWQPFAPGKCHTCHSLTKTYMGTAIGIAVREGLLKLDDLLVDIFPEYREGSTISNVTVHHLLCMGSGVTSLPEPTEDWIRDFFLQPQVYAPGTAYFYNSAGSTLLGFIIERVSGIPVYEYLKPRLFDKIGIDTTVSFPTVSEPKYDMWGHRMQATTEDNLRLMKLYLDGGVAAGERILDEEYIRMATRCQNESATEAAHNPDAADNFLGYGYQMWMCQRPGAYRADGAGGQFSVVVPDLDMIISITESASGPKGAQHTLDCIWKELLPFVSDGKLDTQGTCAELLREKMQRLAIAAPHYAPYSPRSAAISGKEYRLRKGKFDLFFRECMASDLTEDSTGTIQFDFEPMNCRLIWKDGKHTVALEVSLAGDWRRNTFPVPYCNTEECYASGYWSSENTLAVTMLWTEAVIEKKIIFRFEGENLTISGVTDYMPGNSVQGKVISAAALRE